MYRIAIFYLLIWIFHVKIFSLKTFHAASHRYVLVLYIMLLHVNEIKSLTAILWSIGKGIYNRQGDDLILVVMYVSYRLNLIFMLRPRKAMNTRVGTMEMISEKEFHQVAETPLNYSHCHII